MLIPCVHVGLYKNISSESVFFIHVKPLRNHIYVFVLSIDICPFCIDCLTLYVYNERSLRVVLCEIPGAFNQYGGMVKTILAGHITAFILTLTTNHISTKKLLILKDFLFCSNPDFFLVSTRHVCIFGWQ